MSRKVTCNFRLYFEIGRASVKPSTEYSMENTVVYTQEYPIVYVWNRSYIKAQCSLFTWLRVHKDFQDQGKVQIKNSFTMNFFKT